MRGMKGHKARCGCVGCKALRKKASKRGKGKGKSSSSSKSSRKRTAAGSRATLRRLRRELTQCKRGAAKASAQGDAASWSRFNGCANALEARIRAHKAR
jgi:hypothetical protein